ncbi:hypothetical protein Tco_1138062 [Tanacetum coccineum]
MQLEERQLHSNCIARFKELKTYLEFLHNTKRQFEIAFRIFFQEEYDTFRMKITPFQKIFDSKEVNASDFQNKSWQKHFEDYTRQEPENYRCNLLQFLDELDKLIDERVIKYEELQMKEREDNLSTDDTTLDATSVIKGAKMEVCLVTEGTAMDACLVTKGATLDSLVAKEITADSKQHMQQLQLQARIQKEMRIKWFRALQGNTSFLLRKVFISLNIIDEGAFEGAFLQHFGEEFSTVEKIFSQNMDKLKEQLTKDKLHENDSKTTLTALMTPFQSFFYSEWPMHTTAKSRDDFHKYT